MLTNIRNLDFDNEYAVNEFLENTKSLEDFDLTKFQVLYVKARTDGLNQKQSAIQAGSTSTRPEQIASDLQKNPKVRLAIKWYGSRMLQASLIDKETIVDMGLRLFKESMDADDRGNANKTLELLAKVGGLLDKGAIKTPPSKVKTKAGDDIDKPFREYEGQLEDSKEEVPPNNEGLNDMSKKVAEFLNIHMNTSGTKPN